jgi:calcineurin-like phosphoesterase family protein
MMSHQIYVISDLHLGHEAMATMRGFENSEHHDKYLIQEWNKAVRKNDTVWILGDISYEKASQYYKLGKLNGVKKIVLGNHEKPNHIGHLLDYSNQITGMHVLRDYFFTHCPIHPSELGDKKNVHGHIHGKIIKDDRYINVCPEIIGYAPILIQNLGK